ncbi:hypothetical protein TU73_04545 [Pseudomonas libanensis]|uniref:Uncharacterized protein n=1 Tax=Pseudomonas libanensis TaxID=75588 RepID=A0A0R2YIG0_9PSED|nr:hypothetical protein TU73_04545 [Pseudomonas libanensis]
MQLGFQGFGQFAGLVMIAAKPLDPATRHFKDVEKILPSRYNLINDRVRVPISVMQAVVLAFL